MPFQELVSQTVDTVETVIMAAMSWKAWPDYTTNQQFIVSTNKIFANNYGHQDTSSSKPFLVRAFKDIRPFNHTQEDTSPSFTSRMDDLSRDVST